jgi:S1-C subfamily serine protease
MGRKGWILVAVAVVLIVGSLVALAVLTGQMGYRNMTGPVAIVQGELPENGFLGVGFANDGAAPLTIGHVLPGSGAAEAGLLPGDVIAAAGDGRNPDSRALQRMTSKMKPGDTLTVSVQRGGSLIDFEVRLISAEEMLVLRSNEESRKAATMPATRAAAPSAAPTIR